MDKLFLTVLNMGLTGAFVIVAICLIRIPLKKVPKIISYCLWAVAGFRLVFPFSIESMFSLIPFKSQPIPTDIATQSTPRIDSGLAVVDNIVSSSLPAGEPLMSINPLQIWMAIGECLWLAGVVVMLVYGVVSYLRIKRRMRHTICTEANIFETKNIRSPFVLGVLKPKIYLPLGLSVQERGYIILHEQTHIRRLDHIVKYVAYFVLCMHWFNPLVWVAFLLMGVDMEMSCDEHVLKEMGGGIKKDYSMSLLSLATERRIVGCSPLAFGEGSMKRRIKNVLNFKRPSRGIIVTAVSVTVVLSLGCVMNRTTPIVAPPKSVAAQTYQLENMTEKQRFENMSSFTLREDGTASLSAALISSYMPPECTYAIENGELVVRALIETEQEEDFFIRKNGDIMASFAIVDENTLELLSAVTNLYPVHSGRYVSVKQTESKSTYKTREWFNYLNGDEMPWGETLELELPEYPDTVFRWTPEKLVAIDETGAKMLFEGMPIWNIYLADLSGDGLPEFCASVSMGSGIVDGHIVVYDYSARNLFVLEDRMFFDYALYLDDGRLMVRQTKYPSNQDSTIATGELAFVDGKLTAIGIDRTRPDIEPKETTKPQ